MVSKSLKLVAAVILSCTSATVAANDGTRLLATGGATSIEGSAGGGIVPWATLSSYAGESQVGATAALSEVSVDDFRLSVAAASVNFYNRLEVSYAKQTFDLSTIGGELKQNIVGVKARLYGDLVYGDWPQLSAGIQHKTNQTFALPNAVGAKDDSGTDYYISAAKAWLDGFGHRTWVANLTVRNTKANQLGLLGFGGDQQDRRWQLEGSVAAFINRYWAVGVEYRQKPSNLSFAREDDWKDLFVGYFPNRSLAIVAAYTDLGSIAGLDNQHGWYLSLQASF
ncbi:DUF3034 domain-containing protein [Idiomarina tyrosinivorans]|uniref:DUF3034 domain-containing protein n=1 Tax=Idiomarina tyrosinivorans TaxID=1445662 RepID=A0A432ZRE8_9GAMM|nr:DUF3034 family protein [Idiomarina tyrosinivorans]RUO80469.1 DUF3034 domain-containing protein [Idiomarina tyrosinivorans]